MLRTGRGKGPPIRPNPGASAICVITMAAARQPTRRWGGRWICRADGVRRGPRAIRQAAPAPRLLFWRYKFNGQRAVREGDMKLLRIAGNTFLFDVVKDPLERANLKERQPDVFRRLAGLWDEWNK